MVSGEELVSLLLVLKIAGLAASSLTAFCSDYTQLLTVLSWHNFDLLHTCSSIQRSARRYDDVV